MGQKWGLWRMVALGALLSALALPVAAAPDLTRLRDQFDRPADQVDYEAAKLAVDRLIDPGTDEAAVQQALARWERTVRSQTPARASPRQTLDALLKTLYEPGPWNEGRPFAYDLSDPEGTNPVNKRLATYLRTRKGNCVSMPILVVILGRRLGLPITLATAPRHVMAKFADDTQQVWVNVEATAGGFKFDDSYIRETGITELALSNDIYLRPLTPNESVGVIASSLMEHYARQSDGEALLAVAELALKVNARDTVAMIWKANAYYLQLQQRFVVRYPNVADVPAADVAEYRRLSEGNLDWFARAEKLGWTQESAAQRSGYLQSIEREKARRGK